MTQDVQPLTWQKRTNLEEHQQFFSKINEIIDNLAPTVDEAEAAIAQATAAIASANDAIATANAASAAASAAASQAQTAASTVAGYDGRLTAAEGDIDAAEGDIAALQGRMGTAEGNITSLGTRMSAAETKNDQQDTAIAALQTADGQNVKITRINDYAVGLTGNQTVQAAKNFAGELIASGIWNNKAVANVENSSIWRRIYYNITTGSNQMLALFMTPQKPGQNSNEYGILIVGKGYAKWALKGSGVIVENFVVVINADDQLELWVKNYSGNRGLAFTRLNETNWGNIINNWRVDNSTVDATFDPTTYQSYVVSS